MAFQEQAVFETRIASANVTALSFTSSDGGTITYSSGGIAQFTAVKIDTGDGTMDAVLPCSAAGDKAIGIAQDAPAVTAGQPVRVAVRGACKALAGGTIAVGDSVYVGDTSGRLTTAPTTANNFIVGIARTPATAAGDIFTVELGITGGKQVL